MNEYIFDIKLLATIRVNAASESEARGRVFEHLDCASINAGAWPNGDPILFEASVDGDFDLVELNGEFV